MTDTPLKEADTPEDITRMIRQKLQAAVKWLAEQDTKIFRHYKGGIYEVLGFTVCCDKHDVLVRYRRIGGPGYDGHPIHGDKMIEWSRPLSEWKHPPMTGHRPPIARFTPVRKVEVYMSDEDTEKCEYLA